MDRRIVMPCKNRVPIFFAMVAIFLWILGNFPAAADTSAPASTVRLVFVHHSTGGNWLADPNEDQPYGGLGAALMNNNYYVSATNYGWGPNSIGDSTDVPNWPEWFTGTASSTILAALYSESGQNVGDFGAWSRLSTAPAGENTIIMFKSCFPNSDVYGNPSDPAAASPNDQYTVENYKAVYNSLLSYFATRQDKFFVVVTAPPQREAEYSSDDQSAADRAANARAVNNWLVNEWRSGYAYHNVMVFDYFNVLTGPSNHHRIEGTTVEHVTAGGNNFAYYPSDDSHPSTTGHQKATTEFVPLLNYYYNIWNSGSGGGTVETITISGATSVNENSTSEYTLTAYYSDGTSETITSGVSWSDDSSYASISARGLLTADAVDSDQTITITASYGGKSDSLTVTIKDLQLTSTVTSVSIDGETTVNEDSSSSYTLSVNYSDGTSQTITDGANWSVDSSYASISNGGVLVTSSVPADISVTITASFGGASDTHTVAVMNLEAGYNLTSELWANAVLKTQAGDISLVWRMVGWDITPTGAQVISGYFYARPEDFAYGSAYNPEAFVKVYIDPGGWCNIAFNHVTVDDVAIYTAYNYAGSATQSGTITLNNRLAQHEYNGVSIDQTLSTAGLDQTLSASAVDGGYVLSSDLWAKAVLQVAGSPVTLIWKEVGSDITPSGARVISGYYYADPDVFAYGSVYNPEIFVKVYIDSATGWSNMAFNHVTVDDVGVYSAHHYTTIYDQSNTATLTSRLVEHTYTNVSLD